MKISQRLQRAYKAFSTPLGNSVSANVLRNYGQSNRFSPVNQVRGITYKAIDKIGQSVSVYDLTITKQDDTKLLNHPFYQVFDNPNPIQRTAADFQHMWAMLTEIYGETFWYLAKGESTRKIKEIYLLNPMQVELKMSGGELVGYILHKADGTHVPLLLEEVYHDKRPNPFNEWRGMSVIERASQYVDIELATTSFTLNYMMNNASPSGIVSLPNMDKEAFKQFTAQWREGYEGPENAGKTAFIRGAEANFKAVGATLKDIDQEITRKMAKEDVLMMLEVPKSLLGATDDSGFGRASIDALTYIYTKEKIEPMMLRLDRIYETLIAQNESTGAVRSNPVKVTHTSPVPEDKDYILSQARDLTNVALTVNEVRATLGYEAIPGGDEIKPNDVQQPAVQTKELAKKKVVLAKKLSKAEVAKAEASKKEEYRKRLYEINDIYADKLKGEIATFANEQEKAVIGKIDVKSKAYEEWLFNVKDESEKLTQAMLPVMIELMEAQLEDAANFITGELITITDEMRKVVEGEIKKIAGVYNEDTIKALQKTITEGVKDGESLNKISKRVNAVYTDAKGYRAERIARTESGRTSNMTAAQTYFENGYSQVQWFTNPGACEFCLSMKSMTTEINKPFVGIGDVLTGEDGTRMSIDYTDITVPPLHPNCKCSIVPYGKRLQD